MSAEDFVVRRALIDDLPELTRLWKAMSFEPKELEKRLTDFQVAADGQGRLIGAVGFEIAGWNGRIHHEAFDDFSIADKVRPLLWDRIRMLAQNNMVFTLWTQEDAPFWKQAGLQPADKMVAQKLPAKWSNARGGWLMLQLKESAAIQAFSGTADVELLLKMERETTQRTLEHAKILKMVATLLAIVFAMFILVVIVYAFKRDPSLLQQIHK